MIQTELTDEQIEHLAYGVAIGLWCDGEIETLCDAALTGGDRAYVLDLIRNDTDMQQWLSRGANLGYCRRTP